MNEFSQGNISFGSSMIPAKRRRGRPPKDKVLHQTESALSPPGFRILNGNPTFHADPVSDANANMVGQPVTGVVEAVFEAGYLLAVKIGNSSTTLRGVVFKPGYSVPVTAENDVAPHLQMLKRTATHYPTETQPHARGRKPRKEKNNMQLVSYVGNGSQTENQVIKLHPSSRGNYAPAPSVHSVGARGTVVPVVLQPVNLSTSPAPHLAASSGKYAESVLPLNFCHPNGPTAQPLACFQVTPAHLRNDGRPNQNNNEVQQGGETKPTKSSDTGHSSSETLDGDDVDMNEPLFVEPLQTKHVSESVQNKGTGSMTMLLQAALQGNLTRNQVSQGQIHPEAGSM